MRGQDGGSDPPPRERRAGEPTGGAGRRLTARCANQGTAVPRLRPIAAANEPEDTFKGGWCVAERADAAGGKQEAEAAFRSGAEWSTTPHAAEANSGLPATF